MGESPQMPDIMECLGHEQRTARLGDGDIWEG